jgi:hypothetical protein
MIITTKQTFPVLEKYDFLGFTDYPSYVEARTIWRQQYATISQALKADKLAERGNMSMRDKHLVQFMIANCGLDPTHTERKSIELLWDRGHKKWDKYNEEVRKLPFDSYSSCTAEQASQMLLIRAEMKAKSKKLRDIAYIVDTFLTP